MKKSNSALPFNISISAVGGGGGGRGGGGAGGGGNGAYTRFALNTVFYFIYEKKGGLETYQHCAMLAASYDYAIKIDYFYLSLHKD